MTFTSQRQRQKLGGMDPEQLHQENIALRKALGNDERTYTIDEWEATMPQDVRDGFAARALIVTRGDAFRALGMLGFPNVNKYGAKKFHDVVERIFRTPGVQAALTRDLAKPEEHRQEIIARQISIALYADDEASTKAFVALSRVCGWQKTPDIFVQNNRATILALVAQGPAAAPAEPALPAFLAHEPGAAVRIDSDSELVDVALEAAHEG